MEAREPLHCGKDFWDKEIYYLVEGIIISPVSVDCLQENQIFCEIVS